MIGRIRLTAYIALAVILFGGISLGAYFLFNDPFAQIVASGRYLIDGVVRTFTRQEGMIEPPTSSSEELSWLVEYAETAFYSLYCGFVYATSSGGLAWGLKSLLEGLKNALHFLVAVPLIVLVIYLFHLILTSGSPKEITEDSKPVKAARKIWRWLSPVHEEAKLYWSWLRYGRVSKWLKLALFAWLSVASGFFAMALEVIGFYFLFCFSVSGADAWKTLWSLSAQCFSFLQAIGLLGDLLLACWLFYWLCKRAALRTLRVYQAANEDVADRLSVCTAITGAPGIGKTKMMTSLTVDLERHQREDAFSIMKKYASAFPDFDWPSLERWVKDNALGEGASLFNRSQIRKAIFSMWNGYVSGEGEFFNVGAKSRIEFFDGAKKVALPNAADCYAEAYFLYFPGLPLSVTNYAIRFDLTASPDGYFPLYPSSMAYLSGGCRPIGGDPEYSAIVDFDARRIAKRVDQDDVDAASRMDGQVEAYTEVDKERGNRNDYRGLKTEGGANAINDGFNWSVKLTRHDFTIDGIPFTKILMDTQRPDSVNADLRETCEDSIFIFAKEDTRVALPFFSFADDLVSLVVDRYEAFYYRLRAVRGSGKTLLTAVGNKLCSALRNWALRMTKSYGYERVLFKHTVGAGANFAGVSNVEEYYFIKRKVESGLYATDCYRSLADARKIECGKGYLDAPRYSSTNMTVAEMKSQHSYFIDKLVDQTEKSILERRQKTQGQIQDEKEVDDETLLD